MISAGAVTHQALGQQRWPSLDGRRPLVLVPVGSLEQHGPHLPLDADCLIANSVTSAVAVKLVDAGRYTVVAPAVPYGASGEHEGFPGTVSIGHEALHLVLVELARSACRWAEAVIFVNGHGGNVATLVAVARQLRHEGLAVAWTACVVPDADAHAGRTETSLLRFLAPWSVLPDLPDAGPTAPVATLMPRLRREGIRAVSPSGVLGDPKASSVDEGRRSFHRMTQRLLRELSEIEVDDNGRLREPDPARVGG